MSWKVIRPKNILLFPETWPTLVFTPDLKNFMDYIGAEIFRV